MSARSSREFLRAAGLVVALCLGSVSAGQPVDRPADLTRLYDDRTIQDARKYLESLVQIMVKDEILPLLRPEQRARCRNLNYDFSERPLPFNFEAVAVNRTLIIPVNGLKLLKDLFHVSALTARTPYSPPQNVIIYLSLLRYRMPAEFPGGRIPAPFVAFAIPHDSMQRPIDVSETVNDAAGRSFRGALLFILAHEIWHVAEDHRGQSREHETAADDFAMTVIRQGVADPSGLMLFFLYSYLWSDVVLHPLSGDRVSDVGKQILKSPQSFQVSTQQAGVSPEMIITMGNTLVQAGADLNRLAKRTEIQALARETDLDSFLAKEGVAGANPALTSLSDAQLRAHAQQVIDSTLEQLESINSKVLNRKFVMLLLARRLPKPPPKGFLELLQVEADKQRVLQEQNQQLLLIVPVARRKLDEPDLNTTFTEIAGALSTLDHLGLSDELQEQNRMLSARFKVQLDAIIQGLIAASPEDSSENQRIGSKLQPAELESLSARQKTAVASLVDVLLELGKR